MPPPRPPVPAPKHTIRQHMNLREWLLLILLSLLWGSSFFYVGVAVKTLSPLAIVTARVVIAAVILWAVVLITRVSLPRSPKIWLSFLLLGGINNVIPFTLITWGQTHIASSLAAILNATTPLFSVLVAGIFLQDERVSFYKILGVIVGFGGVVILIGISAFRHLNSNSLAQLAVLTASLHYACGTAYARRFSRAGINPLAIATGQLTASALILVLFTTLAAPAALTVAPIPPSAILSVLALGALSTALAYIIYFRILHTSGATNVLLVTFLVPVTSITLGAAALGETLGTKHYLGMLCIGIGLSIIDGRLWKRLLRRRR